MQTLRLPVIVFTAVSLAPAFQVIQPPKSPYERRGLFHATVRGRVVSLSGEPVGGVHIQLNAGRPRSLPVADVVTGADGRFTLSDVTPSTHRTSPGFLPKNGWTAAFQWWAKVPQI